MVKSTLPHSSAVVTPFVRQQSSSAPAAEEGGNGSLPRLAMFSLHGYVAAVPPLGAADTGGQVVYVLELSKKLAQLGFAVDIWTRQFADQPSEEVVDGRVRILRVPCGGNAFIRKEDLLAHLDEWVGNALACIRARGLAYRFVNSHYWDAGYAGQLVARELGVPHLHTPHSLGAWKKRQMESDAPQSAAEFESRYNFAQRIATETQLYESCDMLIATTPPQRDLIVSDYGIAASKVQMIPPGYDDNRFFAVGEASRVAIRQRLGLSGKVVLALGRLARNKGYDLLIDGFRLVAERQPDANLLLAVGGNEANANERQILAELKERALATGYADRIRFGSFIEEKDLADYYRAADLFVLSSRYEPFGMTAIEAMACGAPTVLTVHGGLYRSLSFGRHALFADPFDREDLGITMAKVFRHPRLRARLARMGAHQARSLFTWSGVAHQLLTLVENPDAPASAALVDAEWDEPMAVGD